MNKKHVFESYLFVKFVFDISLIVVAWFLAFYLRFYSGIPLLKGIPETQIYFKLVPTIIFVWGIFFLSSGEYRLTRFFSLNSKSFARLLRNCVSCTLIFILLTFFFEEYKYSRVTLAIFFVLQPILVIAGRLILQKLVYASFRKKPDARILVVAHPRCLAKTLALIEEQSLALGKICALILTKAPEQAALPAFSAIKERYPVYEEPEHWVDFLSKEQIDTVFLALTTEESAFFSQNLEVIASQVSECLIVPDLDSLSRHPLTYRQIGSSTVLAVHDSPLSGFNIVLKRMLDIFGALVAILIFSPVLIINTLLVRLSSKGPIFYAQTRLGLDGRDFTILKFRSMPVEAEQKSGAVWATAKDNRPTKIGKFLRKTSLDEFPQLFNVLQGEMSLVGPRPERPVFVDQFRRSVPQYMLRHKVKAGMTGWAQINGWRGDTSIERRIEHDLFYIQNWSLWLDIKILFLTIFRGFVNPNAY